MTFANRHIGPDPDEQTQMLKAIGYASLDDLMDAAIPEVIRWHGELDLPAAASEEETIAELRAIASRTRSTRSSAHVVSRARYSSSLPGKCWYSTGLLTPARSAMSSIAAA